MVTRNPFIGLFRSPDDGGWTSDETQMIRDVLTSLLYRQNREPWSYLTRGESTEKAKKRDLAKGRYKEKEWIAPEPGAPAPGLVHQALGIQRQAPEPIVVSQTSSGKVTRNKTKDQKAWDKLRKENPNLAKTPLEEALKRSAEDRLPGGVSRLPYDTRPRPHTDNTPLSETDFVPGYAEPPWYPNNPASEEIWNAFRRMNPNLDYAAVARQSGGNVPGGTFSQMPDTRPPAQSDEAFYQWLKDFTYEQELARKQDPRSRAFDPEGAQRMIDEKLGEEKSAVEKIYNEAQMVRANAEAGQLALARAAAEYARTREGRLESTINFILQSVDPSPAGRPDLYDKALRAKMALDRRRIDEAAKILQQIEAGFSAQPAGQELPQPGTTDLVFEGGKLR